MAARSRLFVSLHQARDLEANKLSLWWHHGASRPYWAVDPKESSDRLVAKPSYFIRMIEAMPVHARTDIDKVTGIRGKTDSYPLAVIHLGDREFSFLLYEDETYV